MQVISGFAKPTWLIAVANGIQWLSNGEKEQHQYDTGKGCAGT